jgi:hypothetical protein
MIYGWFIASRKALNHCISSLLIPRWVYLNN